MKKKPNGYVQAVKDFRVTKKGGVVATSTACCADFVPYSFCKRKFELSHGQKYVKQRINKSMPSNLNKAELIPRVLVDHEVGSGKSELAIQIVNDHLKKGLHAVVACPDMDNISTWQREIFKYRGGGELIYKFWNFHPKNLDDSDLSSSRVLKGIYRSQWEKFRSSRKNSKFGMFYIDTHDFVFRSLCALNDFSEKWPGKSNPFAQSTLTVKDKNNTQRRKTLKDQIRAHTRNFLIVVDECHQCIDSTKQKDGNYKYVNSLALLGMLMFAHDSCKIVLMTATALHVTGVGGVGALVYTLYPRPRKSLMKTPSKFLNKKVDENNEKIVLTKLNKNEEDNDENYNENNEDDGQVNNVGGISNENFAKMFLNKQDLRESPPVASSIIRSKPVPSKFSLKVFSEMIGENIKNNTKNTNFLESVGNNGKMKGHKNAKYAVTFAELTVDCIDYFNSIYNKSGKMIVTDATHGVSGFISHWSTAKDASLYPKASLSTCSILTNTTRKFEFDKPCVYPLEVPFAPIHNKMLQPRRRALTNIKKVHDIITKEDPNTNKGTLNQEQRLLGLLQGRQQTMISKLCASDMSVSSSNTNDSKFKCFSKSDKTMSHKLKVNVVKTIVMDVFNHLDKVELTKQKNGSKTQEWVKKGSSIFVIPTSLQSYKDIILNEPPVKPTVFKLTKSQTPEQAKKLASIRKQTIDAKKREVIQLEKNIAETAGKLAPGASKTVSKSRNSFTTTGRKRKVPAKFKNISKATLTKKTRAQLEKDYEKQLQMKNKTTAEIKRLEATAVISFGITEEVSNKALNVKGQIEFYSKELENAKGTEDQRHDLEKLYSEKLVKIGISFLNRLDGIFKTSNNLRLIDAKIRQESRKKFVKIRNDLLKMETGITALSMADLSATVSVNGKKAPELVGQPLSIYGTDEFNPVFFRRPGNLLPMFSLFSTANLMLANIIRSTSNQVNKSTSPDVKRQGSVRVTLPEDKSKGNVMVYVDSAARSEGNELCHSLINQASCIQLESGLHGDTSSVFAVTGVGKVIGKVVTSPSSLIRKIKHKKIDGPIFEFNIGKLYDTKSDKGITPNLAQWNNAMDSYIKDVNDLIKDMFGPPGHLGVDKHVESLLNKEAGLKSIGISAYGYGTRKKKSSNYHHDKDTVAYHNPIMSLLYSVFQHISSEEAISHVESELSLSMAKLDWQKLNGNETYEVSIQKKIESTKNSINLIRQDLFRKIRSVRGHIDKKLKTPVFFRYYVSKQKSVTSGKLNFVHLLNKPSKYILEKIYNIPENNTGDLCNAVISEMTHGGSMFNTPYMVLYHKQQKRQPISNAQRKQIYGRNARNCSMYLKPQNMIKRIDLKTTNSSFFGDENVFVKASNSPSPVRQPSVMNDSPSLSKGNEESANTSPSVNSKSPSANRRTSATNGGNETNNDKTNSKSPTVVMSTRTRKALTSDIAFRSPAKNIPKGVDTFGIKVGEVSDTAPLRHFSTYMGYDAALFQCASKCDLTQQLYAFASKVCNANTTGVLLGQSKVMTENVRELLHCDRDKRLNIYDSNSEVDTLKSHRGMKSMEQNLIFENMRTKAANADMFKNYIRGESATVTENNTIQEKGENTPQNTRGAKIMRYKFAVQLMRTGLYEHWLKTVEKASGSSKDLTKKVIEDFTNKALDAKIPSSRIKSDLMKNAEYVTFKKSPRKKTLAMDYGTFVATSDVQNIQKVSLSKNSQEQIFNLLFTPRIRNSDANSVFKAGWVLEKNNTNRRTGVIRKSKTEFFKMKEPSANPAIALQKHLTMQKNTLNENEQKFLHSREVNFFVRAEAVPQYIRQIPILVKEEISNNAKKLLAGVKIVNITRKMKRVVKPKSAISVKKSVNKKSATPEKPAKPEKPDKKPSPDELKTNNALSKSRFKVIVTKYSFKVLGLKSSRKVKDNKYVYMCSKTELAEEIAKDKYGFQMEIVVEKDKVRCKPVKKSIKEISIPFNK